MSAIDAASWTAILAILVTLAVYAFRSGQKRRAKESQQERERMDRLLSSHTYRSKK